MLAWLAEWVTESWKQIWTLVSRQLQSDRELQWKKQLLIERKTEQQEHRQTTRRTSRLHNGTTDRGGSDLWAGWILLMRSEVMYRWREFIEGFHYLYYSLLAFVYTSNCTLVKHHHARLHTVARANVMMDSVDPTLNSHRLWVLSTITLICWCTNIKQVRFFYFNPHQKMYLIR